MTTPKERPQITVDGVLFPCDVIGVEIPALDHGFDEMGIRHLTPGSGAIITLRFDVGPDISNDVLDYLFGKNKRRKLDA